MARILVAVALLMSLCVPAIAGQRCARRPQMIVTLPEVRLDQEGRFVRHRGETTSTGTLTPEATSRVARIRLRAKPQQLVRCIDALIADAKSKAAKRACTVSAG